VKAKSGLMLLGGVLIVAPALLVANQDQANKPGMEPPVAVVSEPVIPVADSPLVGAGPQEGGGSKSGEAETKGAEVAVSPKVLAADFSEQDKLLADRIEARWKSLVEKDFASAYGYTLPSYRQANTLEQSTKEYGRAVGWRMAQVRWIRYDTPEIARVGIALETEQATPWSGGQLEKRVTGIDETWLNRDGVWWLSPK
jgi:hypothetical protein